MPGAKSANLSISCRPSVIYTPERGETSGSGRWGENGKVNIKRGRVAQKNATLLTRQTFFELPNGRNSPYAPYELFRHALYIAQRKEILLFTHNIRTARAGGAPKLLLWQRRVWRIAGRRISASTDEARWRKGGEFRRTQIRRAGEREAHFV